MSDNVRDIDDTHDTHDAHDTDDGETTVIDTVDEGPEYDSYDDDLYEADDSTVAVVATAEDAEPAKPKRNWRRDLWRKQVSVKPVPVILIVLLLLSGGMTIWLYLHYHQPDQEVNSGVARAAINAASDGTVALLSYSPDTLDKDFAAARSHLTGDFLSYYDQFTQQIVAPAAKQKALKTSAHVVRAAVQELHANTATVLLFVDQSTTSKDSPDPTMAPSSVLVNLALVDGKWLITKFTPV